MKKTLYSLTTLTLLIAWLWLAVNASEPMKKQDVSISELLTFFGFIGITFGMILFPFVRLRFYLSRQIDLEYQN